MLAAARHQLILDQLLAEGAVQVSELSERFGVTPKTIREDLEKLEEKGLLRRTHGGAVAREEETEPLLPLQIPNTKHPVEKEAIARQALKYIEPGDVIALDAGSTTLAIAKLLPNEPLTVLTNDLLIMQELIAKDRIRLVVPGGYRQRNVLIGNEALDWLKKLNVQKLFLSATGIHDKYGLTVFTDELIDLKKAYLASAKEVYCVADHTKFDRAALLTFASLEEVDVLITDAGLDDEMVRRYEGSSVKIERAL
ncbi:DeoR/GlpR family DNA-binding transcription regulator [Cohnella lubricantis]|uniref:DeoR/GlpR transcriptional regulator n=1 Tax=Cohnella lubricantis TaxID=2163172 RepID=A0A841TER7_9BACL|nr:DeoR/GlpR family DNA-binding transcription regulator [Cohnella lubricantis]MBB6679764.1 DeoR/GlpR transcriptional regulator [Cohnella lubricantis]MBP2118450.1 DeoR/GlpR family transcriptional regulator of sugar metabolism [Cohnella lubricantis]